ncbi:sulfotransferase domain-containing protein [uncultured Winogradskyella sp.]|uniref:sulfotransferase domain-containing protein n=1 Tax=Winogradskyella sp. 4-2091 TaxID=3381659 RepID=UPI002635B1EA|nr:sulfotransferase domain-containing protein [uncultured Winogradskyella sp.]
MEETKKNIVIVGYPKSGTTWMSKLVAELLVCPLKGNWGFKIDNDPIEEGQDRISAYDCYKSHHTYEEIFSVDKKSIDKIIYIIRDPRDVVISGLYFFKFLKKSSIIDKLSPKAFKKKQMIKAVLSGNEKVNQWCKFSWKNHYNGYLNKDILFVKYEDLLQNPKFECQQILKFLNIEKTDKFILNAIDKQSFKNAKQTNNLRKGEAGYWKHQLSNSENQLFIEHLSNSLDYFGYEIIN